MKDPRQERKQASDIPKESGIRRLKFQQELFYGWLALIERVYDRVVDGIFIMLLLVSIIDIDTKWLCQNTADLPAFWGHVELIV